MNVKICNLLFEHLEGLNVGHKSSMYVLCKWYKHEDKFEGVHGNTILVNFLFI